MVADLELLGLLIATVAGALTSSLLGWADAGGSFDIKKFVPSIVRAIISALVVFVGTYSGFVGEANIFVIILAYLAGLGIDAGLNRAAGAITGSSKA